MPDSPKGFVTLSLIARDVSDALDMPVKKQSVMNRLKRLRLLERCPMDEATKTRLIPQGVASAVTHSLMMDPPKTRSSHAQRSDDSPVADDMAGLLPILQEQMETLRRALEQANQTIERLQGVNDDLMADLKAMNEDLRAAETQAAEYRGTIAQLTAALELMRSQNEALTRDASAMAYAGPWARLKGFGEYRKRLPAPTGNGPQSGDD